MKSERYQKGVEKIMEFTSKGAAGIPTHHKIEENLKDIAPDVSKFMIEFAYGEIYNRPGLDNQQRALVTISTLVTQGTLPQLELHINSGLTAGLSPEAIVEVLIHLLPYTGFPRVLNALEVAKKVFSQRGIQVEIPNIE